MPVHITETEYENLRENINPAYRDLPDRKIETLFERHNLDAEAMEGFFSDIGKFAARAAPSILPLAGTVVGTAFGGPAGAALGGTLGSLAGKAIGGPAGPGAAGGKAPVAGRALGSPAASQLLQTVLKPETLQALMSMAMGPLGKPNISVAGNSVPAGAFGNLLKVLTGRVEAEYEASMVETAPQYLRDYAGEAKGDPMVAEHRASALYELLESESEVESSEGAEVSEAYQQETEAIEAEYEAMELLELYESEYESEAA